MTTTSRSRTNLLVEGSWQSAPVLVTSPEGADVGVTIVEWDNNHVVENADGTGDRRLIAAPE
jgi:hypothetical protein